MVCGRQDCRDQADEAYRRQYGADFISVMPTNLYGPGDNYHPEYSHAPAALIRRFHEAKVARAPSVAVWGTGRPHREFLAVDDLADACVFVMKHYSDDGFLNIGTGEDIAIADFARIVADVVGYRGSSHVRYRAARRHAGKATGRHKTDGARLARHDQTAGWNCRCLRGFSCWNNGRAT